MLTTRGIILRQLFKRDFFFQAEDGIRDTSVTGVQTCALPIYARIRDPAHRAIGGLAMSTTETKHQILVGGAWADAASGETMEVLNPATEDVIAEVRSEERRVGKERRARWGADE